MEDTPLRRFRKKVLRLSQDELAAQLEMSKASVSRMESGGQPLTIETVRRIAALTDDVRARNALLRDLVQVA